MNPSDSVGVFSKHALANGVSLESCTPRQGLTQMFAFYEAVKPVGCDEFDGDMLLYQWGTYDWGHGRHFELNITRQFSEERFDDDSAMSQLSLTFKFEPTGELELLGAANRWCDGPTEFEIVRAFTFASPAFLAVADAKPKVVELRLSYI